MNSRVNLTANSETTPTMRTACVGRQEPRVDIRQEPRDLAPAVAAHDVDHPGNAGMRREARGDHGGKRGRGEQDLEERAAHEQRHLGKRVVGDLEAVEGREHGLAEPCRDEEDRAADEQCVDDGFGNGVRRLCLLAVHRDRVESDEREAHHGGARKHGADFHACVVERVQREDGALAHAVLQREPGQDDERRDEHDLEHHQDPVDP